MSSGAEDIRPNTTLQNCIELAHAIDRMHAAQADAVEFERQEHLAATNRALAQAQADRHEYTAAQILAHMNLPRTFPSKLMQVMPT